MNTLLVLAHLFASPRFNLRVKGLGLLTHPPPVPELLTLSFVPIHRPFKTRGQP